MRTFLEGTEDLTLEARGVVALAAVRPSARGLPVEEVPGPPGAAAVSLLLFRMQGLGLRGLRGLGLDYGEALFRLAVRWEGEPAWLGLACHLDHPLVRTAGKWLMRYPVIDARFSWEESGARVLAGGRAIHLSARPTEDSPPAEAPRPMLVRSGASFSRIPWEEAPAQYRRVAEIAVNDEGIGSQIFGAEPVWSARGLLHRGRVHRCGLAQG
jgi:hypothetical protein